MTDPEELSGLIGEIYDAALDPQRWVSVLERSAEFIGVSGSTAVIFWHDAADHTVDTLHIANDNPHYTKLYLERYVRLNPMFPASTFFDPGTVTASSEIIPHEELVKTRFFLEWMKPQGIFDALGANIERTITASAVLAFQLKEAHSPASPDAKRRMALLVPHIRRALAIGHLVEHHIAKSTALSVTLDRLTAGVFLVDAKLRLVHSNLAGTAILADSRIVRSAKGTLVATDPEAGREINETIRLAANGDEALGVRGVEISLAVSSSERWLAHVLPLTGGARKVQGADHEAVAALFIRRAALDNPSAVARMASLYKLTASEVRTLAALLETSSVSAIAEGTGVSAATVKTHLQGLFTKTGARRQADLVKLVAQYSNGNYV